MESVKGNATRQRSAGSAWGRGRFEGARARPPWQRLRRLLELWGAAEAARTELRRTTAVLGRALKERRRQCARARAPVQVAARAWQCC
eukprot:713633-Lingulodinium_polyedra.AAC.1